MGNPRADEDAGASNRLARRPEDPTQKAPSTQPARLDPISTLRPGESEDLHEARQRLHRAQAWTAGKAASCKSSFACDLCLLANEAAGYYLFADASAEALNEIADALLRLLTVADAFEHPGGGR